MSKSRLFLVVFFLGGLWSLMFVRGAYLQFYPELPINDIQKKQFSRMIRLSPRRGDILDRDGRELAVSVSAQSLFADPALIENPVVVSRKLARVLGRKSSEIYAKIKNKKRRFVWLARRLEANKSDEIQSWNIRGLAFKEEFKRIYPGKGLAAPLLGYVGREQQGLSGVELRYDDVLTGAGEQIQVQRDARGRALVKDGHVFASSPVGADLVLTIDKDLQFWVESQLQAAIQEHQAEGAWAVVLNPENGEVLAMANSPSFDANSPFSTPAIKRRNRPMQDVYETGSVMKIFTVAGALQKGLVEPNTKINTENGSFKVDNRIIREADKKHSFKELTVSDIIAHSSNIGTSKIALKMKDQALYQTLLDFGFGEKTGIEIPGEGKGILSAPPWRDHLLANISFGHGVAVTALQVAAAYGAIANGGTLYSPRLVKEVRSTEKSPEKDPKEYVGRRVLGEKDASLLKMMLSSVVQEGRSGALARVDGFPVAGKTGTAQKVNPEGRGYLPGHYIVSFAGFVPANDPKYVIYVAVDSPNKNNYYASTVAAPLFRNIAQFALRRDRTLPVYVARGGSVQTTERPIESVSVTQQAEPAQKTYNLRELSEKGQSLTKMPNLKGLTLHEVLKNLNGRNVRLEVQGKGRVSRTYPESGEKVLDNQRVRVLLRPVAEESVLQ